MTFIARLIAILLVSLSTAWAQLPFKERPDITCDLNQADTSGIVLFSSSMPDSKSAALPTGIWYHFNRVGRSSFSNLTVMISREQFFKDVPSDFDGPFGRLYAIEVEAGDYEFRKWTFTEASQGDRTAKVHSPKKTPSKLPFKVTAGRVIYVGSFSPSLVTLGNVTIAVSEQSQRDMQAFAKKCPNLDSSKIDVQPLKSGPWN